MIPITYIFLFLLKITENALATLRIIVISNGKKFLGALLNFLMSFSWIFSTTLVIVDIKKDPIKLLIFSLGTLIGSYLGSIIEEHLALGSNMIIAITSKEKMTLASKLREQSYNVTELEGKDSEDDKTILLITTTRKKKRNVIHLIKRIDKKAIMIVDNAYSTAKS